MNRILILISVVCAAISVYFAGPIAGVSSFGFGFFASILYQKGDEKVRENALAEFDRKREPDNKDMLFLAFAWAALLMCLAIAVSAYVGNVL